jgi:hypothetical protein
VTSSTVVFNRCIGIPWVGRVWDLPRKHAYLRFGQWSKQYGDFYAVTLFGTNHIFLGSDKIAKDLLSKKGTLHQDRPAILQLEDSRNAPEYLPLLGHNGVFPVERPIVVANSPLKKSGLVNEGSSPRS